MDQQVKKIIDFWFEEVDDTMEIRMKERPFKKWFVSPQGFDEKITDLFLDDYQCARKGNYHHWKETTEGCLSLILLFDQFSRNMFRNSSQMYDMDSTACDITLELIHSQKDKKYMFLHRYFIYMPLMHAEDITLQELSLKKFEELKVEAKDLGETQRRYYQQVYPYAKQHHKDIEMFGRFPYRNKVLGRNSTQKEKEFLKE